MLWFISFTLQFSFSRPYFLSIKQWPFITLCVKLQFHQFGGSSPQVTSQQKCIPRFSLTWMNKFPERIRQLFFLLLPDFSREVYFQASGQGAIESLHRFG